MFDSLTPDDRNLLAGMSTAIAAPPHLRDSYARILALKAEEEERGIICELLTMPDGEPFLYIEGRRDMEEQEGYGEELVASGDAAAGWQVPGVLCSTDEPTLSSAELDTLAGAVYAAAGIVVAVVMPGWAHAGTLGAVIGMAFGVPVFLAGVFVAVEAVKEMWTA